MLLAGYAFGTHPWIQKHFEAVVVAIVLLSVMPMLIELARNYFGNKAKA
jgi:membrane-associated protein